MPGLRVSFRLLREIGSWYGERKGGRGGAYVDDKGVQLEGLPGIPAGAKVLVGWDEILRELKEAAEAGPERKEAGHHG
jgi:hypothetical protein